MADISEKLNKLRDITAEQQELGVEKIMNLGIYHNDGTIQGVIEDIPDMVARINDEMISHERAWSSYKTNEEIAGAVADEVTARNAAISAAVADEATARNAAISAAVADEVTARNAAITDAINGVNIPEATDLSGYYTKAQTDNAIAAAVNAVSDDIKVKLYRYGDLYDVLYVTASSASVVLPSIASIDGREFAGWSTTKGSTAAPNYSGGDTLTPAADVSLYAVFRYPSGSITLAVDHEDTYRLTGAVPSGSAVSANVTQTIDLETYAKVEISAKFYDRSGQTWYHYGTDVPPDHFVSAASGVSSENNPNGIGVYNSNSEYISPAVFEHTAGDTVTVIAPYYATPSSNQNPGSTYYYDVIVKYYRTVDVYLYTQEMMNISPIPRYEQPEYINGVKIVEFGKGSYDELQAMISAHKAGLINIYDYWKVGDTRQIHIDAISAYVDNDVTIYDAMPEQNVYATLWSTSLMSDENVLFIVAIGAGMYNTFKVHHDTTALANGFADSDLQNYLDVYLYSAMESGFKSLLSSFSIKTFVSNSLTYEGTVYMTLPSAKEFAAGSSAAVGEGINNAFDFFSYSAASLSNSVFASWQRVAPSNDAPYAAPYGVWTRGSAGTSGYAIGASAPANTRSGGASVYTSLFSIIPIVAIK